MWNIILWQHRVELFCGFVFVWPHINFTSLYFLHLWINTCHHCPGRRTMIKIKINSWSHWVLSSPVLINILSPVQLISSLHNNYLSSFCLCHTSHHLLFFLGNFVAKYFSRPRMCATWHFPLSDIPRHDSSCDLKEAWIHKYYKEMLPAFISLTRALTRPSLNILSYQNISRNGWKWLSLFCLSDPTLHPGGQARN